MRRRAPSPHIFANATHISSAIPEGLETPSGSWSDIRAHLARQGRSKTQSIVKAVVAGIGPKPAPKCHPSLWPVRVGCRPSLLTKAAIQAAYLLNVGNLRDTGHTTEAMPPAAMAEQETFAANGLNFRPGTAGVARQAALPRLAAGTRLSGSLSNRLFV